MQKEIFDQQDGNGIIADVMWALAFTVCFTSKGRLFVLNF